LLRAALAVILVAAVTSNLMEASHLARIEHVPDGQGFSPDSIPSSQQVATTIARLEQGLERRTDDAEGRQRLAELWLTHERAAAVESLLARGEFANHFQAGELSMAVESRRAAAGDQAAAKELWDLTAPLALYGQATRLSLQNRSIELENLRNSPGVVRNQVRAGEHLLRARNACPLLPRVHLLLAELAPLSPSLGPDTLHLDRARRMAGSDVKLIKEISLVELQAGRTERFLSDWRRIGELAPNPSQLADMVFLVMRDDLELSPHLERILPDNAEVLVDLVQSRLLAPEHAPIRSRVLRRANELVSAPGVDRAIQHYVRGMTQFLEQADGSVSAAIDELRSAVRLRPQKTLWHYWLAVMLHRVDRQDAARDHATICVEHEPTNKRYQELLERVTEKAAASSGGS
jgi:hypothetical protein